MNSLKLFSIGVTIAAIAVLGIFGFGNPTSIVAEENDDTPFISANEIVILVTFTGQKGTLETDGFQIFKQMTGFDKNNEAPTFKLEGVVSDKHPILYEAADWTFEKQGMTGKGDYDHFNVDVILHKDGTAFRQFSYTNCALDYYAVDTKHDKEEGWNTSKGFAIVDEFTFECNGYQPSNPTFELEKTNGYHRSTVSTMDLTTDLPTWEEHHKFQSMPFEN